MTTAKDDILKNGEQFKKMLSKIAPLEWSAYQQAISDVKREDYRSDSRYELALQNTWEFPRFCFRMFRPALGSYTALLNAVKEYKGAIPWLMHDDCIGVFQPRPPFAGNVHSMEEIEKHNQMNRRPPDEAFVEKAVADIPLFCAYLETRLDLASRQPQAFDPNWLTADGLAKSKGEFEDFIEPGLWAVALVKNPQRYLETFELASPQDRRLSLSVAEGELLNELGAKWSAKSDKAGDANDQPVLPDFPLLSRLSDVTNDATYEPSEVKALLAEIGRAQKLVKEPRSVRALDNLVRIARWAQKLELGIYFGGV